LQNFKLTRRLSQGSIQNLSFIEFHWDGFAEAGNDNELVVKLTSELEALIKLNAESLRSLTIIYCRVLDMIYRELFWDLIKFSGSSLKEFRWQPILENKIEDDSLYLITAGLKNLETFYWGQTLSRPFLKRILLNWRLHKLRLCNCLASDFLDFLLGSDNNMLNHLELVNLEGINDILVNITTGRPITSVTSLVLVVETGGLTVEAVRNICILFPNVVFFQLETDRFAYFPDENFDHIDESDVSFKETMLNIRKTMKDNLPRCWFELIILR
jgi:hypothetical protein